jgi:hypothetical protein
MTLREHLVHLVDKSPRVTNTQRLSVKCLAWRLRGSLKRMTQISLRSLDWSEAWRREFLGSRNVGSKCFQNSGVANLVKEAWSSFYSPQKESFRWGVRDLDISGLGAGHIHKCLLEPGLGTGHVQCLGLTQVNSRRPDMSSPGTEYVQKWLL